MNDTDQLIEDLNHQIEGFQEHIKSLYAEVQKLNCREFSGELLVSRSDVLNLIKHD